MRFINDNQFKTNLKKFGFDSYDNEALEKVNELHQKVVKDLLKQTEKHHKKVQSGGRVAFPIDYFGGHTNGLSTNVPQHTDITPSNELIRPAFLVNDSTQVLGTEKGMTSGMVGGAKTKYQVSKSAAQKAVTHVMKQEKSDMKNKLKFVEVSNHKFQSVMDDVLQKSSSKDNHLSIDKLEKVLKQKKYQSFKL
jgi:hypothetical protein